MAPQAAAPKRPAVPAVEAKAAAPQAAAARPAPAPQALELGLDEQADAPTEVVSQPGPIDVASALSPEAPAPSGAVVGPGGGGVEGGLFDDLEHFEPQVSLAPTGRLSANASAPWPTFIPSGEAALAVIEGRAQPPDFLERASNEVLATIPTEERAFEGAAVCWRVGVALATKPAPGEPIDTAASEAMLAEIDAALEKLRQLPPEVTKRLSGDLVRDAVDLTEYLNQVSATAAKMAEAKASAETAARKANAKATASVKVVSASPEMDARDKRSRRVSIAFGVVVVLAAGFHGWRIISAQMAPTPPGVLPSPAGTTRVAPGDGKVQFVTVKPGEQSSPEAMAKFRQELEAQGKKVQEVGPGRLIVMSEDTAGPSGPSKPETGK